MATNPTSMRLSNQPSTFGVQRDDTGAVLVADDTPMTFVSTGLYEHSFVEPAGYHGPYTAWVEVVHAGNTYWIEHDLPVVIYPGTELNLKDEHLVFDGLQNVLLNGNPILGAYPEELIDSEGAPSEGVYLHGDMVWQIPTPPAIVPRIGQLIVDGAGRSFSILAVRQPFLNDYYGCTCRQAKIESDLPLSHKITRYPAIIWVDEEGSRIVANAMPDPGFTDVPAKVQDVSAEHADFMGKRGFSHLYHIFLDSEIDLVHGDVLKDQFMDVYDVVTWTNRDRIDELSMIVAGTTGN